MRSILLLATVVALSLCVGTEGLARNKLRTAVREGQSAAVSAYEGLWGPGFRDLVATLPKKEDVAAKLEIRNTRFEAAVGIAAGRIGQDNTLAYKDVLRRIISFRLADPAVKDWEDAIGQLFQLPGASTDPAADPKSDLQAFILFSSDRSGVPLYDSAEKAMFKSKTIEEATAASKLLPTSSFTPVKLPTKQDVLYKFTPTADKKAFLSRAVKAVYEALADKDATIREITHLMARITECGEGMYEAARTTAPGNTATVEADAWFQPGCMRWMIKQVYDNMDKKLFILDKSKAANPSYKYAEALLNLGFSAEHFKKQYSNLYKPDGNLRTGDDNLDKKGWLNPLPASLCRSARPNGGNFDASKTADTYRTKKTKPVFRFKPPKFGGTKLTNASLKSIGLPALSPRETNFLKAMYGASFNAETSPIGWGVGGYVWLINGKYDPASDKDASADADNFLTARKDQLMTTAAGPSGTTDEFLQMFDYCGLTQISSGNKWHLYNGILGALANMVDYYHHSFLEVMEGAGASLDGKTNLADRDFTYNASSPFDWLAEFASLKPKTQADFNWAAPATKPMFGAKPSNVVTIVVNPLQLQAAKDIFLKITTGSPLEKALLTSDFPDQYTTDGALTAELITKMKGPHLWTVASEKSLDAAVYKAICDGKTLPSASVNFYLLCDKAANPDFK